MSMRTGAALLRVATAWLALVIAPDCGAGAADGAAERNFRLHCMGCHQADGSGSPQQGVPDLRREVGLFLRVPGGRAYLSQVPGALNTSLDDAQTAGVLNWVVRNIAQEGAPPDFVPYTAADVAQFRRTVPADILADRASLLALVRKTLGAEH